MADSKLLYSQNSPFKGLLSFGVYNASEVVNTTIIFI